MKRFARISARERRVIAVGAATVAMALVWTFAIGPYLARVGSLADRLERERRLLRRELALIATVDSQSAVYETGAERLLTIAPRLLSGDREGAMLQAYVDELVDGRPIYIESMQPVTIDTAGPSLTRYSLRLSGETDLEGLLMLLSALEHGPKLVHVRDLRMNVPANGGGLEEPERIEFGFTAVGFSLAGTAGDSGEAQANS